MFVELLILFFTIGTSMPDDNQKLLDAYRQAQQMDSQQVDLENNQRGTEEDDFLNVIGQIESSGGKNFDHEMIQGGMHKGHRATGTYGLMPNTITETLNRMRMSGQITPELEGLSSLGPIEMKQAIETNPELEKLIARHMARQVLDRQGNDEKAAYSWFQGHNLSPEQVEARDYGSHDYVNKFRKYKGDK